MTCLFLLVHTLASGIVVFCRKSFCAKWSHVIYMILGVQNVYQQIMIHFMHVQITLTVRNADCEVLTSYMCCIQWYSNHHIVVY